MSIKDFMIESGFEINKDSSKMKKYVYLDNKHISVQLFRNTFGFTKVIFFLRNNPLTIVRTYSNFNHLTTFIENQLNQLLIREFLLENNYILEENTFKETKNYSFNKNNLEVFFVDILIQKNLINDSPSVIVATKNKVFSIPNRLDFLKVVLTNKEVDSNDNLSKENLNKIANIFKDFDYVDGHECILSKMDISGKLTFYFRGCVYNIHITNNSVDNWINFFKKCRFKNQ